MRKKQSNNHKFSITSNDLKNLNSLLQALKSSLNFQKEFINDIDNKLCNICNNLKNKDNNPNFIINSNEYELVDEIINLLPEFMSQLGIPFAYLLFKQGQIFQNLLLLCVYEETINEKIAEIFEIFLDIFDFSLYNDDIIRIRCTLIEYGLVQNLSESRGNLNSEKFIFEQIFSILNQWNELKNIGKDIDNIYKLEESYNEVMKEIKNLPNKMKVTQAHIEFYKELIKPLGDYLNSINMNINLNNKLQKDELNEYDNFIYDEKKNLNNETKKIMNKPLSERTFFYQNERLQEKVNQVIEFRNYRLPLNEENGEDIKRQICGFLNSQGGRLYIGIDERNIVQGIFLNYKKRDNLRNQLINLTYDFFPKCRLDKVLVYFIPIKDIKTQTFIQNLFIIKIRVYPGDPEILYSMSSIGYHSTIRNNGICKELNTTEIYNEMIKRDELKNNDKNNFNLRDDIKDPDPEVNPQDLESNDDNDVPMFEDNNLNNNLRKIKERSPKPKKKLIKNMVREGTIKVKVSNIDEMVPVNDVNRFFNGCRCASQRFFKEGYGYLNFSNLVDANNCVINYNGKKIGKKKIKLKIINDK